MLNGKSEGKRADHELWLQKVASSRLIGAKDCSSSASSSSLGVNYVCKSVIIRDGCKEAQGT